MKGIGGGGTIACGGGSDGGGSGGNGDALVVMARSVDGSGSSGSNDMDGCSSGDDGGWTTSFTLLEQPLEREETPFFSQIMARVCGGAPSPHVEPKMGQDRIGRT